MVKILDGFYWLEDEIGDNTEEINECLEEGLIKYLDDNTQAKFIVLESNIDKVKEILKEDYNKIEEFSIVKWVSSYIGGCYQGFGVDDKFGDRIFITIEYILDCIENNEKVYFSNDKELEIYNSECPYDEIINVLNEVGREQAKIRINYLLNSISTQKIK